MDSQLRELSSWNILVWPILENILHCQKRKVNLKYHELHDNVTQHDLSPAHHKPSSLSSRWPVFTEQIFKYLNTFDKFRTRDLNWSLLVLTLRED